MAMLLSTNPYELFMHPLLHQQAAPAIASAVCLPGSNEPMLLRPCRGVLARREHWVMLWVKEVMSVLQAEVSMRAFSPS